MSFEGMDVDQLRGLASQVNADAQTLSDLVTTLTGVAGRLPFHWQGPVATAFEQDWQAKYRPALLAACNTLTALHAHLVSNINQQAAASAADPGGAVGPRGAGLTAGRMAGDLWSVTKDVGKVAGVVLFPAPFLQQAAGKAEQAAKDAVKAAEDEDHSLLDRLKDGATRVKDDVVAVNDEFDQITDEQAAAVVSSPEMKWLRDSADVRKVGDILNSGPVDKVIKRVTVAGIAVGAAQTGADLWQTGQDLRHGYYGKGADEAVDTVSDGLKTIPTPVTYLVGVDVKLVSDDVKAAYDLDWSDVPNPLNADNFRKYYLPQFTSGATWKQSAKVIWGAL